MFTETESKFRDELIRATNAALEGGVAKEKVNEIALDLFLLATIKSKSAAEWYYLVEEHHHDLAKYAEAFIKLCNES